MSYTKIKILKDISRSMLIFFSVTILIHLHRITNLTVLLSPYAIPLLACIVKFPESSHLRGSFVV